MTAEQSAEAPARHHLGDLVLTRKEALRLSYERLAARCVDPESDEQTVKGSWLHRVATRLPVQAPTLPQLRGMAAGLEVPLRVVQDAAAAQFFGMDALYSQDAAVRSIVPHLEEMSPEDRRKIQALIEAYRQA
ncbi:XRE family transcriptional regulator [Streptomyces sanyensis]|uniref:XRE family transcriptional regulator n=1 Tax=Streptomyces sanyensis TaxID=568869 RepID=UPI003D7784E9